jgi:hypothetical protein
MSEGDKLISKLRQWYWVFFAIIERFPRRYALQGLNFLALAIIATFLGVMIEGGRYYVVAEALKDHPAYHQYVNVLYREFPELRANPKAYIAKDDALLYLSADKSTEVVDAVFQLLNHFEHLSVLYNSGLADPDAFEASFKDMLGAWYGKLGGWLEAYNERCGCTFAPFEKLGKKWIPAGRFTERAKPRLGWSAVDAGTISAASAPRRAAGTAPPK